MYGVKAGQWSGSERWCEIMNWKGLCPRKTGANSEISEGVLIKFTMEVVLRLVQYVEMFILQVCKEF